MFEPILTIGQKVQQLNVYIKEHLGPWGLATFYLLSGYFAFQLVLKILKIAFQIVLYVFVPSLILAYWGSVITSFSIFKILPFTSVLFMGLNILKR
ncbi:MAG: hypothetical protein A2145_04585 [candidate division Zixibacteria bacterium RBG_16_40_9]|nr:MAG: hypothetical protein A2145_04585 [candidate division Zixibacteria bacterium RBG_16_40_9]